MTGFAIARMLHVLALGIGGAGVATTVLLPSIRRSCAPTDQLRAFHTIAARFAQQSRWTTAPVGASGIYM